MKLNVIFLLTAFSLVTCAPAPGADVARASKAQGGSDPSLSDSEKFIFNGKPSTFKFGGGATGPKVIFPAPKHPLHGKLSGAFNFKPVGQFAPSGNSQAHLFPVKPDAHHLSKSDAHHNVKANVHHDVKPDDKLVLKPEEEQEAPHVLPKTCIAEVPRLSCEGRTGILRQIDGGDIEEMAEDGTVHPFNVQEGATVNIAVCAWGNVEDPGDSPTALIPQLVGNVGKNAKLRIFVYKSGNVKLTGTLSMSTTLVGPLIRGKINPGASVEIDVEETANIDLAHKDASVTLSAAILLGSLIDTVNDRLDFARVSIDVRDSANIRGAATGHTVSINNKAFLQQRSLRTKRIKGSHVFFSMKNVANVFGVHSISLSDRSGLSRQSIFNRGSNIVASSVNVFLKKVATVADTGDLELANKARLFNSAVRCWKVRSSSISISVTDLGTTAVDDLDLKEESRLVRDLINSDDVQEGSWIEIDAKNVASVVDADEVSLSDSDLLQGLARVTRIKNGISILVNAANIAIVEAKELEIDDGGTLVDSLVKFTRSSQARQTVEIKADRVANAQISDDLELKSNTHLIRQIVASTANDGTAINNGRLFDVKLTNSGSLLCAGESTPMAQVKLASGAHLVKYIVRVKNGIDKFSNQVFSIELTDVAGSQLTLANSLQEAEFLPSENIFGSALVTDVVAGLDLATKRVDEMTECPAGGH